LYRILKFIKIGPGIYAGDDDSDSEEEDEDESKNEYKDEINETILVNKLPIF